MDNFFERKYSVELSKLRFGLNEEVFKIDRSFFTEFEFSQIEDGDVEIKADITKESSHLDVILHFKGTVMLNCDRCMEPYPHPVEFEEKVIFTTDEDMEFDHDEVVIYEDSLHWLPLYTEFFDFLHLQIPFRKVPPKEVHLCPPAVLEILGLDAEGNEIETEQDSEDDEEIVDPRWAALKKLKDQEE